MIHLFFVILAYQSPIINGKSRPAALAVSLLMI